jgi:hydrogenase expression/formation protein HypC
VRAKQKDDIMCLGIPGQVIAISDPVNALAIVDVSGVRREINLLCVISDDHPIEACLGDWVLVHVGFAMSRIDEQEAAATLKILEKLGEVEPELTAMQTADHS